MRTRPIPHSMIAVVLSLGLAVSATVVIAQNALSGDAPIVRAARAGDADRVAALVGEGADVNAVERDGTSALAYAAYHADLDMTRTLVNAGASVDVANLYGVTPLLQASRVGDARVIEFLLNAGADPMLSHPDGETPLMAASRTGGVEAIRMLLARGAEVNAADWFQDQTPLMWAAAEGHADAIRALLEAGAEPNLSARLTILEDRVYADHPTGGFTALMYAARNGHQDVVDVLAEGGADLNAANGDGATAMMIAIINDRFDLAAHMLDLGADAQDGSLYFAMDMRDATTDARARDGSQLRWNHPNELSALELMEMLLERGADPNKPFVGAVHSTSMGTGDTHNANPFYRAAVAADIEALELLIAHGADITWTPSPPANGGGGGRGRSNFGRPATISAMTGGDGMALGGGPGFSRLGDPVWREAGTRSPIDALALLIDAGLDVNAQSPDGTAPIHQAVSAKKLEMIQLLADSGADLELANNDEKTPLMLAEDGLDAEPRLDNNGQPVEPEPDEGTPEQAVSLVRELLGLPPAPPPSADADVSDAAEPEVADVVEEVAQ